MREIRRADKRKRKGYKREGCGDGTGPGQKG